MHAKCVTQVTRHISTSHISCHMHALHVTSEITLCHMSHAKRATQVTGHTSHATHHKSHVHATLACVAGVERGRRRGVRARSPRSRRTPLLLPLSTPATDATRHICWNCFFNSMLFRYCFEQFTISQLNL